MSKQPPRDGDRRQCYFCGQVGPMSKEHAWAQWLKVGAVVEPTRTSTTVGFQQTADDTFTELPNQRTVKQGSVLTAKTREVCRSCNNGWMSGLEEGARPILERLWVPTWPFGGRTLAPDEGRLLATWATKTAWMHERVLHTDPTPPAEQRRYLMDERRPPPLTSVWAAHHEGRLDFDCRVARLVLRRADLPWESNQVRNVMVTGLVLHKLALIVRTSDGPGIAPMPMSPSEWLPVWPWADGPLATWPPRVPVSDERVLGRLAYHADWATLPALPNFVRHFGGWQTK